ncbi:MAG: 23S rRNA (guanosine(2251)-2'-O)-methyltransferase RlmB [Ginsengibacter sp.]
MRQNRANFQHKPRPKKSSLIIGPQKVLNALREHEQIDRIFIAHQHQINDFDQIKKLSEDQRIPINRVPIEKINGFNIQEHEGIVALRGKIQYQDLQQVISFVVEKGATPLFIILDGITDVRNIGALARTAWCCGVQAIIIPDKGVGALNDDAIAASAGALELIYVCRVQSLTDAVEELHLNGIEVFATDMEAHKNVYDLNFTSPAAIIMGSEDQGISGNLLKVSDHQCKIPMVSEFESLNVSVAAGMVLYEAMKQRLLAK